MKKQKKVKNERYYQTEDAPRTGQKFYIVGVQFKTYDQEEEYTEMICIYFPKKVDGKVIPGLHQIWNIGPATVWSGVNGGVKKEVETALFDTIFKDLKYRNLVAMKIHYLNDPDGVYQII